MNYQEKVCTAADVRALYERVIANPAIKRYRGYTATRSYAWDPEREEHIKREGEVWFGNPAYDESFVPEGNPASDSAELLEELLNEKEKLIAALDAKCEKQRFEIEALQKDLHDRAEALDGIKASLLALRGALAQVMNLIPED